MLRWRVSSSLLDLLFIGLLPFLIHPSESCDETLCRSIVSKCQLLQKCNCQPGNSTCSVQCFKCLDYLDMKCCSCVSICPVNSNDENVLLSAKSHVEELTESMPTLFSTLTEEGDHLDRWSAYTFPVRMSFISFSESSLPPIMRNIEFGPGTRVSMKSDGFDDEEDIQANCTVAFMSQCIPLNKCKASCTSMGASSYRWFHDGCCQCVGANCINYGLNESRCTQCPQEITPLVDTSLHLENQPLTVSKELEENKNRVDAAAVTIDSPENVLPNALDGQTKQKHLPVGTEDEVPLAPIDPIEEKPNQPIDQMSSKSDTFSTSDPISDPEIAESDAQVKGPAENKTETVDTEPATTRAAVDDLIETTTVKS